MALSPGTRLGPYEITAQLGSGGMGEVYRAMDTLLKRSVAIKVLPESVADDVERLARFQREAEVLAQLNHPNIAAIYGLERSGGRIALVMELVEGPTLADGVAHGAVPVDEALEIAAQIVEAVEAAHERGIIHRDLKPANIKVRLDGVVKVLDFGLAKALEPSTAVDAPKDSTLPTMTSPAVTRAGAILGTAAYMSPEQAKGRPADSRSDAWAFGCVLYEMLAGKPPFPGEDVGETIASVLAREPDWDALPATTPGSVSTLLHRCLAKDRQRRIGDIAVARYVLEEARATPLRAPTVSRSHTRGWFGWAAAAAIAMAWAAGAALTNRDSADGRRVHLVVPLPNDARPAFFALSPDGQWVVMADLAGLWLRSLESGEVRMLPGTERARDPFWSPDSRNIAFFSPQERTLGVVPVSGGVPQVLCRDAQGDGGGTWNRQGVILFSSGGVLQRVSASGGACEEFTRRGEVSVDYRHPVFLPDGEHFLYQNQRAGDQSGLFVGALTSPMATRLLPDGTTGLFAPDARGSNRGYLLFVREQALMAHAFDVGSLTLSGDPVKVADHVTVTDDNQIAASVADDGTLMYLTNSREERQMVWYDRSGQEAGRGAATRPPLFARVSLSRSGDRVSYYQADELGRGAIWLGDPEGSQEVQFTRPPMASDGSAVWSPDGRRIAFAGARGEARGIWLKDVEGGTETLVLPRSGGERLTVSDWSSDGQWLAYTETNQKTGADIWVLHVTDRAPAAVPLLRTLALETQAQFSPDGRWLAYVSNEVGGREQVFMRRFENGTVGEATYQVSSSGSPGVEPRWRADGKELFYKDMARQGWLMSVAVGAGANPVGMTTPLFDLHTVDFVVPPANIFGYAPAPDGRRFLVDTVVAKQPPTLDVILNWASTR